MVLLRALLASRFQQHEYATLAAADLDDDGALSAEERATSRVPRKWNWGGGCPWRSSFIVPLPCFSCLAIA